MTRCFSLVSTAVLAALLLGAPRAEARFGKSSSSGSSHSGGSSGSSGHVHASSPVHAPTPWHAPAYEGRSHGHSSPLFWGSFFGPPRPAVYVDAPYAPGYAAAPVPLEVAAERDPAEPLKHFRLGFDFMLLRQGSGGGLHLGIEGERLGFALRAEGLSLRADDGGGGEDSIALLSTHLSWAVLAGERGRVRLEGGLSVARAPEATFVGPSLGGSAELYVTEALALEGRAHVTPVPYRQVDVAGGLAVYFFDNLFALRGGMRVLVLDDAGLVDGVAHRDVLPGPYVSLGLAI